MKIEKIKQDLVDDWMDKLITFLEAEHPHLHYTYHPFSRTMNLRTSPNHRIIIEGCFTECGELSFVITIQGRTGEFYPQSLIPIVKSILKNDSQA